MFIEASSSLQIEQVRAISNGYDESVKFRLSLIYDRLLHGKNNNKSISSTTGNSLSELAVVARDTLLSISVAMFHTTQATASGGLQEKSYLAYSRYITSYLYNHICTVYLGKI